MRAGSRLFLIVTFMILSATTVAHSFQDPFFRFRNKIRYAIKRHEAANEEQIDKSRFAEWITPSHLKHLEPGTSEWNMAMFESLIGLRDLGIGSGEFFAAEEMNGHPRVICKMEPYNECFSINENGHIRALGNQQRPARLLRVY